MSRKVFSFLLSLGIILSLIPTAAVGDSTLPASSAPIFTDVQDHWAQKTIEKWSNMGIIKGSDGFFRPDDSITRGEMAVILDRIMNYQTKAKNSFSDLSQDFYTDSLLKANAAGVILGDGNFVRPTDKITREEAAVMLGRALGIGGNASASSSFSDRDIDSWALDYVKAMADKGYVQGFNGRFNPKANITRAELVTILNNIVTILVNERKEYTGDADGTVIINTPGATLKNIKITGDLIITQGVGSGDITLNGVTVTGKTIVRGGGANSIHIEGYSQISDIIIEKTDSGEVRVVTSDGSVVNTVNVNDGNDGIILTGSFQNVTVASGVSVNAVSAMIGNLNITAGNAALNIDKDSNITTITATDTASGASVTVAGTVGTFTANAQITVANSGTILNAVINADYVIINGEKPSEVKVDPSVTNGPKDSNGNDVNAGSTPAGGGLSGGGGGGLSGGGGGGSLINAASPVITNNLTDAITDIGITVTLDATATVADQGALTYAWYSNTSASTAGGTTLGVATATYQPEAATAGIFYYFCVVTNTNDSVSGSKTATTISAVSAVTVLGTGTITGTVKSGDTKIEDAKVCLSINGIDYSASTNKDGTYSIPNIPFGTGYTVTASKFAYTDASATVSVTTGKVSLVVDLSVSEMPATFTKVTSYDSAAGTLSLKGVADAIPFVNAVGSDTVSAGDYVNYTVANGIYDIQKAVIVTEQLEAFVPSEYLIYIHETRYFPSSCPNASDLTTYDNSVASHMQLATNYTLYLDPFNRIVALDESKTYVSVEGIVISFPDFVEENGIYKISGSTIYGSSNITLNSADAMTMEAYNESINGSGVPLLVRCSIDRDILTVTQMSRKLANPTIIKGQARIGYLSSAEVCADSRTTFAYYVNGLYEKAYTIRTGIDNAVTADVPLDVYCLTRADGTAFRVIIVTEQTVKEPVGSSYCFIMNSSWMSKYNDFHLIEYIYSAYDINGSPCSINSANQLDHPYGLYKCVSYSDGTNTLETCTDIGDGGACISGSIVSFDNSTGLLTMDNGSFTITSETIVLGKSGNLYFNIYGTLSDDITYYSYSKIFAYVDSGGKAKIVFVS